MNHCIGNLLVLQQVIQKLCQWGRTWETTICTNILYATQQTQSSMWQWIIHLSSTHNQKPLTKFWQIFNLIIHACIKHKESSMLLYRSVHHKKLTPTSGWLVAQLPYVATGMKLQNKQIYSHGIRSFTICRCRGETSSKNPKMLTTMPSVVCSLVMDSPVSTYSIATDMMIQLSTASQRVSLH